MEKRAVAGIAHSSDTKHRIVRRPGQPLPDTVFRQPTPDMPGLLCLNKPEEDAKDPVPSLTKLLAYQEVAKKDPSLLAYYVDMLGQLSKSAPEDPDVLVCLGRKALLEEKDYPRAADYLSRALERGSEDTTTFLYLGEALSRTGRVEEAVKVLEQGTVAYPYAPTIQKSLAFRYLSLKQYSRARDTMKHYLELFPEDAFMRGTLESLERRDP
jgi:tetratricopeptide (TPR) repeat protein